MVKFLEVDASSAELKTARSLLAEYRDALPSFMGELGLCPWIDNMDVELVQLPWEYVRPTGLLLVAQLGGSAAGSVALRSLTAGDSAELRRLYVRPAFRGHGVGRLLLDRLIAEARAMGFRRLVLNTLPSMKSALAMYRKTGFMETAAYVEKPSEGVMYMSLVLWDGFHPAHAVDEFLLSTE